MPKPEFLQSVGYRAWEKSTFFLEICGFLRLYLVTAGGTANNIDSALIDHGTVVGSDLG